MSSSTDTDVATLVQGLARKTMRENRRGQRLSGDDAQDVMQTLVEDGLVTLAAYADDDAGIAGVISLNMRRALGRARYRAKTTADHELLNVSTEGDWLAEAFGGYDTYFAGAADPITSEVA